MTKPRARKQLEARERARLRRQAKDAAADREAVPERAARGTFGGPAADADAGQTAGPQGAGGERPVEPVLVQLVNNEGDRATELQCPWCATVFPVKPRGRVPTWCSPACRQRAWEQARAAASGRSAVTVVERIVNTPVFTPRLVNVQQPPPDITRRSPQEWADQLHELARLIDSRRVYDRDLNTLAPALSALVAAYNRRGA